MASHNPLNNGQPQATAREFCREERIKNLTSLFLSEPTASVGHFKTHEIDPARLQRAFPGQILSPDYKRCSDCNDSVLFSERFRSVGNQVHYHLPKQWCIELDCRKLRNIGFQDCTF